MKPIAVLPVFIYTEDPGQRELMGLPDPGLSTSEAQDTYFFRIDALSVYPMEGDGEYTVINAGGMQCISPMPIWEILAKLKEYEPS